MHAWVSGDGEPAIMAIKSGKSRIKKEKQVLYGKRIAYSTKNLYLFGTAERGILNAC